jgi:GNAT superfamily N-acetyltransferase
MHAMPEIRKAIYADAGTAWEIRAGAVMTQCHEFYPRNKLEAWVAGEPSTAWMRMVEERLYVAEEAGRVIATGMIDSVSGKVDAIFVAPDYMGKGVGRAMMDFLERMAREHGLRQMHLEATLNAAPFYRRHGFTGEEISLYRSPRGLEMECIRMVRTLADPAP